MSERRLLTEWPLTAAKAIVKPMEGFRGKAYKCPAGVWTIGFGHTGHDVYEGCPEITREEAEVLLDSDLVRAQVELDKLVYVTLTYGQTAALLDFMFNFGPAKCRKYTLFKLVNQQRFDDAAKYFSRYVYGGGVKLPGLVRRRELERKYFTGELNAYEAE